jgi:hypothetical protein
MKPITLLACLLLAAFAAPSFAHDSMAAQECVAKADKIKGSTKRTTFLYDCIKNIEHATFVKEEKAEQCNQNAKNMKLSRHKEDLYLEHCYQENDFNPHGIPHPEDAK